MAEKLSASQVWRQEVGLDDPPEVDDCTRCQFMKSTDRFARCPNHKRGA